MCQVGVTGVLASGKYEVQILNFADQSPGAPKNTIYSVVRHVIPDTYPVQAAGERNRTIAGGRFDDSKAHGSTVNMQHA
jgi:hypothetical protein